MKVRLLAVLYLLGALLFIIIGLLVQIGCLVTGDAPRSRKVAKQFDDAANVAMKGEADMAISGRIYRKTIEKPKSTKYKLLKKLVDGTFKILQGEDNHCKIAYLDGMRRGYRG